MLYPASADTCHPTMPSSSRPYKSKLLTFVLQQWQQGLERQDRAWRQLQSTTTWGAQVAIFPIYVIIRAVERARFAIDSSKSSQTPTQNPAKAHVTDIEHSLTAILSHTQQLLSPTQKRQITIAPRRSLIRQTSYRLSNVFHQIKQQLTDKPSSMTHSPRRTKLLQHKLRQIPEHLTPSSQANINRRNTSDLLQNGTTLASALNSRKLVLVNLKNEIFDIFTPEQQSDLQYYITRIITAYEQSRNPTQTIVPRHSQKLYGSPQLTIEGQLTHSHSHTAILRHTQQLLSSEQKGQLAITPQYSLISKGKNSLSNHSNETAELTQNGTTLASSLQTRKLVLVNLKNEVFDIFTPEQQTDINRYIAKVMSTYRQRKTIVRHQAKPLSAQTILAIGAAFIEALPIEFHKAWSNIAPRAKSLSLPPLKTNSPQPNSRVFYPSSVNAKTFKARTHRLSSQSSQANHIRRLSSKSPHAFETDVNDASYLEHPLERILRWIDHVLTWCERRWQQWLDHRTNIG